MPRLHPIHYADMNPEEQLAAAISHADATAVWNLIKDGTVKPDASALDHILWTEPKLDQSQYERAPSDSTPDPYGVSTFVLREPGGRAAETRSKLRILNMLLAKGVDPLQRYEKPGNPDMGFDYTRHTIAAQEAFAPDGFGKPNLALSATLVLRTLAAKPDWHPDTGHIFRNILATDGDYENQQRAEAAKHIRALGLLVGSRLQNDKPEGGVDRAAQAAVSAMSAGQISRWTNSGNWKIDPEKQPKPTEAMRAEFGFETEDIMAVLKEKLRKNGVLGPA